MNFSLTTHGLFSLATACGMALLAGCSSDDLKIELPAPAPIAFAEITAESNLTDPASPGLVTKVYNATEVLLDVQNAKEGDAITLAELDEEGTEALVSKFQAFENRGITYRVLPAELAQTTIEGTKVKVTIADFSALGYGDFLYPVAVTVGGKTNYHFIHIVKEPEFTPLSSSTRKPMPPSTLGGPAADEPMKMIAYVETNDMDPRNMMNYVLEQSKQPVFDYIVLFAANINWNAVSGKRYISFNDKLQPIVNNPDVYIQPIRNRGIKLIVSLLPNHQGVGFLNFQSYEEALEFAKEAKVWCDKTGIDGWDIDEEYAEYNRLPELPRNDEQSYMWFMKAMKEVMPDKILTLYEYADTRMISAGMADEDGKHPVYYIDESWSDYNVSGGPMAGLPRSRYGNRSLQAAQGNLRATNAKSVAETNLKEGNGNMMIFAIPNTQIKEGVIGYYNVGFPEEALSEATMLFYGQKTVWEGQYYPGPKDKQ